MRLYFGFKDIVSQKIQEKIRKIIKNSEFSEDTVFKSVAIAINKTPIIKPVGAEDVLDSSPAEVLISPDKAGAKDESSGTTEYSILKPLECSTASSLLNLIITGN